jgi:hypothetical protein
MLCSAEVGKSVVILGGAFGACTSGRVKNQLQRGHIAVAMKYHPLG